MTEPMSVTLSNFNVYLILLLWRFKGGIKNNRNRGKQLARRMLQPDELILKSGDESIFLVEKRVNYSAEGADLKAQ